MIARASDVHIRFFLSKTSAFVGQAFFGTHSVLSENRYTATYTNKEVDI